jgi:UPF0271 protein
MMNRVDLNCDLGEGGAHDAAIMPLITSANIACGAHAGDHGLMFKTVALARSHGVAIGAHPGYADRVHFGRIERPISAAEMVALVTGQVSDLIAVAGELPRHLKLHGALYNQVCRSAELAEALVQRVAQCWPQLRLFALAGSPLAQATRAHGLAVVEEAFMDRAYEADGTLTPRSMAGAVLADADAAAARAVAMVRMRRVSVRTGGEWPLQVDTLCLHGDGHDPVGLARAVRARLAAAGVTIAAPDAPAK